MPAKKKTVKKAAVKKAVAKKPIKKIAKPAKKVRKLRDPNKSTTAEQVSSPSTIGGSMATEPVNSFYIVHAFADHLTIFGIANDQRVYRWNPRAGVWVLHKEGEQP